MKFILTSPAYSALPVYMAQLQNMLETAKTQGVDSQLSTPGADPIKLNNADIEKPMALITSIEDTAIYDEALFTIIQSEYNAYMASPPNRRRFRLPHPIPRPHLPRRAIRVIIIKN